jgi:hypothetical protein
LCRKVYGERLGIELGYAPGFRDGADIHKLRDVVGFQHRDKLFQRLRGVADREDRWDVFGALGGGHR